MLRTLLLLASLTTPAWASPLPQEADAPSAHELTQAELHDLDGMITDLVADGSIVGGELLVIQDREVLLHTAHGWADREENRAMQIDGVFCVRSMTKPLIGVAVMMLVDEGKVELDQPAHTYLPLLDHDTTRAITVRQLLHHLAGFPMTLMSGASLDGLDSIQTIAAMGTEQPLAYEPGTAFRYSDHGTDTLTALVESVSGMSAAAFVESRILQPLGMDESLLVFPDEHPLRARTNSKYMGTQGEWRRYWKPDDAQIFPIFLGSQSMHSTTKDYARFAQFLLDEGYANRQQLLSEGSLRAILEAGPYPLGGGTGLPGARTDYGKLMQLWTVPADDAEGAEAARRNLAFGHTGSDGTHCWIFPESRTIVLYFTQSRGTLTGIRVEEKLGEILLGIEPAAPLAHPPHAEYLGYYSEGGNDRYRAIVRDGDEMSLEILGQNTVVLAYEGDDRWKVRDEPSTVLAFQRDEQDRVTGFRIGDHEEFRFWPDPTLPSGEEISARVLEAHGLARLEQLGPLRLESTFEMPAAGISGESVSTYAWPDRFRIDAGFATEFEYTAYDGEVVTYASKREPAAEVTERARIQRTLRDQHLARLGDWSVWQEEITVVQQVDLGGKPMYLVRAGDLSAPGRTFYVEVETGRVLGEDCLTVIPGLGRFGMKVRLDDYREIEGMWIPHRLRVQYPVPMLGRMTAIVQKASLGEEPPAFRLTDDATDAD